MAKPQPGENCFYQEGMMEQEELANLLDSLSTQIEGRLSQFNLKSKYTHEDIKSDVFLLVQKLIASERLELHLDVDEGLDLVLIKGDLREPIINPRAWLRTVALNYIRALCRQHKRFLDISSEMWDSLPSTEQNNAVSPRHTHPMQYIENLELRENIKQLPDQDSEILELFYFEKLSCAEISSHLEHKGYPRYTEENIRQKKFRALNKLRKLYL
ncbi:sigma-70 family RNA polymerase sigma factor [Moorena sp. SIO3A2]|uniref:sigma-70 family RNA polymerase sigma factor n=1 Tax=Moorena sp. SIO3A2 TaxID=2607841 RepID=UPI0013B64424|nr:sigma-70 family RNA polymerase sigma factor [Moorena sp. SIO3A2]NER88457.1 sigma-70 family RNA polymerase sigma factor [Moorena sp. SIO3A2]